MTKETGASGRGFAGMSKEKQRAIASAGGKSVPNERRSFSKDRKLAVAAGQKGGTSVLSENRSFSKDRELAVVAGRKGGSAKKAKTKRQPATTS